jgi:hypothetical protein
VVEQRARTEGEPADLSGRVPAPLDEREEPANRRFVAGPSRLEEGRRVASAGVTSADG